MAKRYTAEQLRRMPTISTGQADDLKVESDCERVWICRCGVTDGMPYDDAVSVENLKDGKWIETDLYRG